MTGSPAATPQAGRGPERALRRRRPRHAGLEERARPALQREAARGRRGLRHPLPAERPPRHPGSAPERGPGDDGPGPERHLRAGLGGRLPVPRLDPLRKVGAWARPHRRVVPPPTHAIPAFTGIFDASVADTAARPNRIIGGGRPRRWPRRRPWTASTPRPAPTAATSDRGRSSRTGSSARAATFRARSRCCIVLPLNHFAPDILR